MEETFFRFIQNQRLLFAIEIGVMKVLSGDGNDDKSSMGVSKD